MFYVQNDLIISSKPPKIGIVMHHLEPECHVKRLVCYFQDQGHSKGWYDQNMTVSTIFSELMICLLPNLVWYCIIITLSILWRFWIAVFKVKATAKFQNVNEYLSRPYLLNHLDFSYRTWYGDASSWARLSVKKNGFLSSRSRSQCRII